MPERTILIVEDNAINRILLKSILSDKYEVEEAENGEVAMNILNRMDRSYSAILLDLGMPVMDGYQVLREIGKSPLLSQIPIVVTTGNDDKDAEIKALNLGATDYITKPYNSDIVLRRLENLINLRESSLLISALQTDRLTGLYKRDAFFTAAEELIKSHSAGYYTLSAIDIEKFSLINERYGTARGDEILKRFSDMLMKTTDLFEGLCSRITADNFAVLLPTAVLDTDEFHKTVSQITMLDTTLTFSIGRYRVDDLSLPMSGMYDRACLAKASVKGRYDKHTAVFDKTMFQAALDTQRIVDEMKNALEGGQFEAWYQPQYNNFTGALIGAEALARWRHPQRGLIPPGIFIPVFEQNGFIYELDKCIWEHTCAFLRSCIDSNGSTLPISVNISRYDIYRSDLFDVLMGLLEKYRLPTELLRLEITESAFSSNPRQIIETVTNLTQLGFTVEIDDFGSGFSSLNILKDVPARIIKLDMRFLEGSNNLERGGSIIESVVRMAKWLDMPVIAEGVETQKHAEYLKSIGCHYSQGYYYARPMPKEDFSRLLKDAHQENKLSGIVTVENLNNNTFWDPNSMDTIIFNSYVGSACIVEYYNGKLELLRVSARYSRLFENGDFTVEDAQKLDWISYMSEEDRKAADEVIKHLALTHEDATFEAVFNELPVAPGETYLRFHVRVIASTDDRCLIYAIYENTTNQRKAEKLAREVSEQINAIMENVNNGISVLKYDDNDRIVFIYVNERHCALTGITKEQYKSKSFTENIMPDDIVLLHENCKGVLQNGSSSTVEYRIKKASGEIRWMRTSISPLKYPGEEKPALLAVTTDITESEKTQRELLDNLPGGAGIYEFNNGRMSLTYQNKSYWELVGLGDMSFPDPTAMSAIHPDDIQVVMQDLGSAIAEGRDVSCEIRLRHLTDGYIHVHLAGRIVHRESGGFLIYATFTPTRPETVAYRQMLPRLLSAVMESNEDFAFAKDKELRYICCSPAFLSLVGASDEKEIIGKTDEDIFPAKVAEKLHLEDTRLFGTGKSIEEYPEVIHTADGEQHHCRTSKYILRGTDGEIIGLYGISRDITEEHSALERLKLLNDSLPGGIATYRISPKGIKITYFNDGFCKLMGCTREEYVSLSEKNGAWSRIYAEDLPHFKEQVDRLITDGTPLNCMFRSHKIDGSGTVWINTLCVISERDGDISYVNAVLYDCTSQKESELRRHEADERVNAIMANIDGGIVAATLENGKPRILFSNDKYFELLGYTRAQYFNNLKNGIQDVFYTDDRNEATADLQSLLKGGEPIMKEFRVTRGDGSVAWLRGMSSQCRMDGIEGPVYIFALFDVTSQKEADKSLRIRETEYRLAIEGSDKCIYRYNHADNSVDLTGNSAPIYGMQNHMTDVPESMIRNSGVDAESVETYREFFNAIKRGDKTGSMTIMRRVKKGEKRWYSGYFKNVFDNDGKPISAIVVFGDVTEQREKESVYTKWHQSFEKRSADDYTLIRLNLTHGERSAEDEGSLVLPMCDREVSFDKCVLNYAENNVFPEDKERYISFLDADTTLAEYHRGMRSKELEYREIPEDGKTRWLKITAEFVEAPNLHDIESYILFENIDDRKKAELEMLMRAETDPLTGLLNRKTFEERVKMLISNRKRSTLSALFIIDLDGFKQINDMYGHAVGDDALIEIGQKLRSNFRDQDLLTRFGGDEYMIYLHDVSHISAVKEKAALLTVLLHKLYNEDVQLSASIGIAVCPSDGEDFDTLYRKSDTALYFVKQEGKNHYALYNESMGEGGGKNTQPANPNSAARRLSDPSSRKMLIVEDNAINRDFLVSLFEADFVIDTVAEGTAALIKLKRYGTELSIVLLDLMLPGIDGFEVLREMRENPATQSLPVIVVSGLDERENCLKALHAGAYDFVTKPIDPQVLKLRVASALSRFENEQLRAQNRFLAMQNEETKRLSEAKRHSEELSVALHAAERADIAKTQFLSNMSHEIRTPLNALIGYNSMARTELSASGGEHGDGQSCMRIMDCLTKSEIASKQLLSIVNDVLDISAIEAGRIKVDSSPFDFKALVSSLTVMFFAQARAKGVNFEVHFEKPTEEWFKGDQMRLNQVLTNLLSNAVKFTPEGGDVVLTIKEEACDEKTASFCFTVSDTGIGMTPEYLTHIWTPFEQADTSISRRFGGSGLGLSITKNLVELMHGTIDVKSESGAGSEFNVKLTFERTEQPERTQKKGFSHINALVVDDDVSTCDYIKMLFNRCGAACMTFTSGNRAVSAYKASLEGGRPFNLCLIDWRMPVMDGFATIREIRRIATDKLPIVVITAYDFADISEQAKNLNISKFIYKPLFQSSLFDLLMSVSGGDKSEDSKSSTNYDLSGKRVLLVEDNDMNVEVATHILKSVKLQVDCASNGQEAVDIFKASGKETYLAVLMDVHMPKMDGYQATRIIRACDHPDAASIPIIAMTADVFAKDIEEAHQAGMNAHIAKPIDAEALLGMLSGFAEKTT